MKVLTLTKYSYEGPSSRYRFYNYQECLKKEGIDLVIQPLFTHEYFNSTSKIVKFFTVLKAYLQRVWLLIRVLFSNQSYDLLLIEYELFPFFPALFEYLLHKKDIKYIVDYDDAIFHKYDMSENRVIKVFLSNKVAKVIQYAEYVIVCNPYLENYAKKYNARIWRLPTVVLLDRYQRIMQNFTKKVDNTFVIGWIGSKSTSRYIIDILPAMKRFLEKYNKVSVKLVGFDKGLLPDEISKEYPIAVIEWSEEKEIEDILSFDVGIMPLHDDPWSRGKCGFKLIQYMSCKKPVIASPVGINTTLVQEGENGFLVKSADEWERAFERLYADSKLREEMAEKNFQKIENEFNHYKICAEYSKLIQQICSKGMK